MISWSVQQVEKAIFLIRASQFSSRILRNKDEIEKIVIR